MGHCRVRHLNTPHFEPYEHIGGVPFGCAQYDVVDALGEPAQVRQNYDGEVEFHYFIDDAHRIYRCFHHRFVECTFPDDGPLEVGDIAVLSVYDWLATQPDAVDVARFRVSLAVGLAYDRRDRQRGSITVFAKGHWDNLIRPLIKSTTGN